MKLIIVTIPIHIIGIVMSYQRGACIQSVISWSLLTDSLSPLPTPAIPLSRHPCWSILCLARGSSSLCCIYITYLTILIRLRKQLQILPSPTCLIPSARPLIWLNYHSGMYQMKKPKQFQAGKWAKTFRCCFVFHRHNVSVSGVKSVKWYHVWYHFIFISLHILHMKSWSLSSPSNMILAGFDHIWH